MHRTTRGALTTTHCVSYTNIQLNVPRDKEVTEKVFPSTLCVVASHFFKKILLHIHVLKGATREIGLQPRFYIKQN